MTRRVKVLYVRGMIAIPEFIVAHALELALTGLSALLAPLFALAAPKVHAWIDSHVKSATLKKIMEAVADAALVNVQAVAQTTVDAARATGGVPADVAAAAKKAAIEGVKRDIGPAIWAALVKSLGSEDAALASIATHVEASVKVIKTAPSGRAIVTAQ